MSIVDNFLIALAAHEFKSAEELLAHFQPADVFFRDNDGNTLTYYVIKEILKFNTDQFEISKKDKWSSENIIKYDVFYDKLNLSFRLIQKMLNRNIPYLQKNNLQQFPLDLFKKAKHSGIVGVKDIEAAIVEIFDEKSEILHAGRKFVTDISLVKSRKYFNPSIEIPDKWRWGDFDDGLELSLHQRLRLNSSYLKSKYSRSLTDSTNLVSANLGFLIKKINADHQSLFVSIPITDEKYIFYKKLNAVAPHSEEALIDYLLKPEKLFRIIDTLAQSYKPEEHKIILCVLDIDSTIEICFNCEKLLRQLQVNYDNDSFLKKIEKLLNNVTIDEEGRIVKGFGFTLPKKVADRSRRAEPNANTLPKIPIIIRASGVIAGVSGDPDSTCPLPVACGRYNHDIKTHTPGVILHLPPRNEGNPYSLTCNFFSQPKVKSLYDSRPHRLDENSLVNLEKNGFYSIFRQTAFISNSGSTLERNQDEKEGLYKVHFNNSIKLTEENFPQGLKEALKI